MSDDKTSSVVHVVVGVDVGGTNTDAVVLSQGSTVIAAVKEPTSADVTTAVRNAIHAVLQQATDNGHRVAVVQVNIGTTHFVNAVVQGRGLARVSVIRLCGTASLALPPFSDFPLDLKEVICDSVHLVDGGYRFDGKEIDPVDEKQITDTLCQIKEKKIRNIVVSGIFSPVKTDQEDAVFQIIANKYPEASVTLSHKIGHIGLLERENAAILNECLKPICKMTVEGFQTALASVGLSCPMYLTQNDGTIISSDEALLYPVYTFASGPTNSMRGAAFLSDVKDAIVLDIGGTTTDVGVLKNRFPREASTQVKIGGIRTNFRMPDVLSIGLGGGSYVTEETDGLLTIGPFSAGYNLKNEAFIFSNGNTDSGRTLTTSDVAVAAGLMKLGDAKYVQHLSKELVEKVLAKIVIMIEDAIDMVKLSGETLPVLLVGGGSVLVDRNEEIKGASEVIIPEYSGVANAIGAALSQVSGSSDSIVCLQDTVDQEQMDQALEATQAAVDDKDVKKVELAAEQARKPFFINARDTALENGVREAKQIAVDCGADPTSVEITQKEDMTLSYIPGQAVRIKIKAVGNLKNLQSANAKEWIPSPLKKDESVSGGKLEKQTGTSTGKTLAGDNEAGDATKHPVDPQIDPHTGEWILSEWDLEAIVIGSGIFGCGGGGNPHIGRLLALKKIREGKEIRIISPEKLFDNSDLHNDLVAVIGAMGAPLISYEQLASDETTGALRCLDDLYTIGGYKDGMLQNTEGVEIKTKDGMVYIENYQARVSMEKPKRIIALMSGEIGGMNAIEPLLVSADLGLPVVDSDGIGRAFPELQMFCPYMYGVSAHPAALVDDRGTRAVMLQTPSPKHLENHFRDTVIGMGCSAGLASPLNKADIMEKTVLYTFSHAWKLGDAVLKARIEKTSPIEAILKTEKSVHIITGKIRDVQRETSGGFNRGKVIIEGLDCFSGQTILVDFQNENLVVFPLDAEKKAGKPVACVPDLITIVDADTAEPIPTEEAKYGIRVAVLVLASPDILRTDQALRFVGPKAFHYDDVEFRPIGDAYPVQPIPPRH
ncbi:uncharacterized protein LOC124147265 [Haliotis rufescens]|uniref:uncharacterized protein LOC124147265 n=1 Tax=Haliotis rufescens TaxID=6454 RepID=UPI00201EA595|nr:uncharacterized protein LOC124147265 [Haliotis rufescens]XP_046373885.2 uncharacterized protein LOC124147265 [Haliotis rufescens]